MNRRSDTTKRSLLAGLALAAVVALGSLCSATDHPARPNRGAETFDSVTPPRASRPFDEAACRVQRLTESLEQSRGGRNEPAAACGCQLLPGRTGRPIASEAVRCTTSATLIATLVLTLMIGGQQYERNMPMDSVAECLSEGTRVLNETPRVHVARNNEPTDTNKLFPIPPPVCVTICRAQLPPPPPFSSRAQCSESFHEHP
jgi:hypothetical protein